MFSTFSLSSASFTAAFITLHERAEAPKVPRLQRVLVGGEVLRDLIRSSGRQAGLRSYCGLRRRAVSSRPIACAWLCYAELEVLTERRT